MPLLFILAETDDKQCQCEDDQGNIEFKHISRAINYKSHKDHCDPDEQDCDKY